MNRRQIALGAVAALAAGAAQAKGMSELSGTALQGGIEGRVAVMDGGVLRAGFPGVVLRLKIKGGAVRLDCAASSETVYLDICIDKGPARMVRLAKGSQKLELFASADTDWHLIEVFRRNESWQGVLDLKSASCDGQIKVVPPAEGPKLMFIGDSITCGEAVDAPLSETRDDIAFANAGHSYGKVLARRLGAQCHLVSCGGRGLIRSWQGIIDGNQAPQFYERAAPDETSKPWDHRGYVPDIIGIGLGTNDFSSGIPDEKTFVLAYVEFVQKLRRDAPKAHIFLIDSPLLTNDGAPKRAALSAFIDEAITRLADHKVTHAPLGHYPGRPTNAHPIASEHVAMADALEPLFRAALKA